VAVDHRGERQRRLHGGERSETAFERDLPEFVGIAGTQFSEEGMGRPGGWVIYPRVVPARGRSCRSSRSGDRGTVLPASAASPIFDVDSVTIARHDYTVNMEAAMAGRVVTPGAIDSDSATNGGEWKTRIVAALRFIVGEFGPLLAFGLLSYTSGITAALVGVVVVVIISSGWRLWRRIAFTRMYILSSSLTLVFGLIDLFSAFPFMLRYEAVITNAATGVAFVAGAQGAKSLIQEFAEQRRGQPFPERADIRRFFQLFTLAWAVYFFVKAAFYLWIGLIMPLAQAIAVRSLVGGISLGVMIALSITQGPRLFELCRRLKLLPAEADGEAAADGAAASR